MLLVFRVFDVYLCVFTQWCSEATVNAFTTVSGVRMVHECVQEQSQKLSVDQAGWGDFPLIAVLHAVPWSPDLRGETPDRTQNVWLGRCEPLELDKTLWRSRGSPISPHCFHSRKMETLMFLTGTDWLWRHLFDVGPYLPCLFLQYLQFSEHFVQNLQLLLIIGVFCNKARQSMCWRQYRCQGAQHRFGEQMHQYEEAGLICTQGCCCLKRKGWVTV